MQQPDGKLLILFDGYCNLCNRAVQFVIKRDTKDCFRYSALDWPIGEALRQRFPQLQGIDSIVLYDGERVHVKSDAALRVAGKLGGIWPVLKIFMIVPRPIRNAVYNWIARNRYRWFGKEESCMVPTAELQAKFLRQ